MWSPAVETHHRRWPPLRSKFDGRRDGLGRMSRMSRGVARGLKNISRPPVQSAYDLQGLADRLCNGSYIRLRVTVASPPRARNAARAGGDAWGSSQLHAERGVASFIEGKNRRGYGGAAEPPERARLLDQVRRRTKIKNTS